MTDTTRSYNGLYFGEYLNRVAFPLGGIGAGMVCIEGTGKLSHVSVRHKPEVLKEPLAFSAISIKNIENGARVLEGPVPKWKQLFPWSATHQGSSGNGGPGKDYGLPRYKSATFLARFPFATVRLEDPALPVSVEITAWSPFIPTDSTNSSLPVASLEYGFRNTGPDRIEAVYYFNSMNFMALDPWAENMGGATVKSAKGGFSLHQASSDGEAWREGTFSAFTTDPDVNVNHRWFRGGWFDPLTMVWNDVEKGAIPENPPVADGDPSSGATLSVPFSLEPGEEKAVKLLLSWYVPQSSISFGKGVQDGEDCCDTQTDSSCCGPVTYEPWYAAKFDSIDAVSWYWIKHYDELHDKSVVFRNCFYDTSLPEEIVEAVAANLTILKSPTVLRQRDGRLWCWEGCGDSAGCCAGSCTHVWNYAQALPHLFPKLERTLRQTEFYESQTDDGRQNFRSNLPIRDVVPAMVPAADGQLGGIIKVYRDWRICGDDVWVKSIWPKVKQSLDFCIAEWDPDHTGVLVEPHHNTYDIEFWGPDGMCSSFYLGALKAAVEMGTYLDEDVSVYVELLGNGKTYIENNLFDGEYFYQKIVWEGLRAGNPTELETHLRTSYKSEEAAELLRREGPKYQYGTGCLSDGVLGEWMALTSGIDSVLDEQMVESHLQSVFAYNFREDLSLHANPQRPTYALGDEGGLLLCSWPKGGKLSLPFVYSDEVWTGIEYQVASHLAMADHVAECLRIVQALRDRYDGKSRNPFNEYECGHWYARAMASYALIQGMTGARYDAVTKILHLKPGVSGDFRAFISTASGYGTVGVKNGEAFLDVISGSIEVEKIKYVPAEKG